MAVIVAVCASVCSLWHVCVGAAVGEVVTSTRLFAMDGSKQSMLQPVQAFNHGSHTAASTVYIYI